MKSNKLINLLSTAIIGLTLCACGGGGGTPEGSGTTENGTNQGNNTTQGDKNNNNKAEEAADLAPKTLYGLKLKSGSETFTFSNGCSFSDAGGMYYSGSYNYTKTGPDTGTLSFNLTSYSYGVETTMKTNGILYLEFCKTSNKEWVNIDGEAASRVENSVTMTGGMWKYRDFNSFNIVK